MLQLNIIMIPQQVYLKKKKKTYAIHNSKCGEFGAKSKDGPTRNSSVKSAKVKNALSH